MTIMMTFTKMIHIKNSRAFDAITVEVERLAFMLIHSCKASDNSPIKICHGNPYYYLKLKVSSYHLHTTAFGEDDKRLFFSL